MKLRIFFLILFIQLGLSQSFATPQRPDVLIYEGKEYPISSVLLESYFENYPDRKPQISGRFSSLWRGYIAVFEIVSGALVLKDISANFSSDSSLATVVPDGRALKIDWYTGLLVSGYGDNSGEPYSLEHDDSYESYSIFEIDAGNLRSVRHFNNKQYIEFRERQFRAYKKTPEYRAKLEELAKSGRDEKVNSNIIRESILNFSKKFLVN